MAIQQTPPPPQKKSNKAGWGCLGCGCLIVILVFLLGVGVIGGGSYFLYTKAYSVTSDTAAAVPSFSGGEDVYAGVVRKLDAFNQDVAAKKPSTLTLSADEINALASHNIGQNQDLKQFKPQLFISLNGSDARLQGCLTLDAFPGGLFKGRYVNFDGTTGISFDPETKEIDLQLRKFQLGSVDVPSSSLASLNANLSQSLNQKLRQNPTIWSALQAAKRVEIKDGQFVIETQ